MSDEVAAFAVSWLNMVSFPAVPGTFVTLFRAKLRIAAIIIS